MSNLLALVVGLLAVWIFPGKDRPPPHGLIDHAYFYCEKCHSLVGGIFGKGPVKRFDGINKQRCDHHWQKITRAEFKALAAKLYAIDWAYEAGSFWRDEIGADQRQPRSSEVNEIIERAIKFAGCEDRLRDGKAVRWVFRSTLYISDVRLHFRTDLIWQPPAQLKATVTDRQSGASPTDIFTVVNGAVGWIKQKARSGEDYTTDTLSPEDIDVLTEVCYLESLTHNPMQLKDTALKCSVVAPTEPRIRNRAVVALKVLHPKFDELRLYYDAQTGMLLKREALEHIGMLPQKVPIHTFFTKHGKINGIAIPLARYATRDGERCEEAQVTDSKIFKESFPASVFEKP
jgi:hypothetical protein